MTNKEIVDRVETLAQEALNTIQPEGFWYDVRRVCWLAKEAAFHLSETLVEGDDSAQGYAARSFLRRWREAK